MLPIEFQSRTDPYMALRIMTYVGLLYQDLVKNRGYQPDGLVAGKLPPVLSVVLYNGVPRWGAATDIAELIEVVPAGLAQYRPSLRYLLLDEGALDESEQLALRNLAAALFRLEKSNAPEDMRTMVGALSAWLRSPEQTSLRRAFTVWIRRVLLPARLPGVSIPELVDLQEVQTMLAERVVEWTEQWKQQGLRQGMEEGRQQGMQQGNAEILQCLLEMKFGAAVTEAVQRRLQEADSKTLQQWSARIFSASTIEEVFIP